jgi:hypothetical protein
MSGETPPLRLGVLVKEVHNNTAGLYVGGPLSSRELGEVYFRIGPAVTCNSARQRIRLRTRVTIWIRWGVCSGNYTYPWYRPSSAVARLHARRSRGNDAPVRRIRPRPEHQCSRCAWPSCLATVGSRAASPLTHCRRYTPRSGRCPHVSRAMGGDSVLGRIYRRTRCRRSRIRSRMRRPQIDRLLRDRPAH